MSRVFTNLIKNAVDAMQGIGKITIAAKESNGSTEFAFTDTGPGIREEILPKLFLPLFTTKAQGMGFGLAISKRSIEAHGGKIYAESEPKKGTTITVELPTDLNAKEPTFLKSTVGSEFSF
jgi:signal transduction histidine kinase